jgi:tellurite resistance protein
MLGANFRRFLKAGFFVSSWAYSFPLAAITIATFLIGKRTGLPYFLPLASALLAILSVIITVLLWKTQGAIRRKAICLPE